MEFRRLYTDKKFLAIAVFLVLLNLFLFVKQQKDAILYDTVSIREISQRRNDLIEEYSFMNPSDAYEINVRRCDEIAVLSQLALYRASRLQLDGEYDELYRSLDTALRRESPDLAALFDSDPDRYTEEYFYVNTKALSDIRKRQEYLIGYGQTIEKIEAQAIREHTIRIFKENTQFSQNNIRKTVQDFGRIKKVSLQIGNDEVLTSILDYPTVQYLILLFILLVLIKFLRERKTGLWELVHSSKNGRGNLALRRGVILLGSVAGMNVLMYSGLLAASLCIYGKWEDLFRTVQSIEMFHGFTVPMTVLEFMLFKIAFMIVTDYAVALFLWLVLSAVAPMQLGLAVSGAFLSVEWVLYHFLPVQSNVVFFKYVNLFCYLHVSQELIGYRNIDFFTLAVGRPVLILGSAGILCFLLFLSGVRVNQKKRPFRSSRFSAAISKWIGKRRIAIRTFTESSCVAFSELYKVLFLHKGLLILGALCAYLIAGLHTGKIYYAPSDYIVNRFYEQYEGIPTAAAMKYKEDLAAEIGAAEKVYTAALEKYRRGEISYDEMAGFKSQWGTFEDKVKALEKIDRNVLYLRMLAAEKRIDGWFVNPRPYDHLIGDAGNTARINDSLLILFCLVLLLSNLFAYEYRCSIKNLLHSTRKGRKSLFIKKFATACGLTLAAGLLVYGFQILNIHHAYGINGLGAPVQSLPVMNDCILPCSIGAFLALLYGMRLLMLMAVACGIVLLSVRLPQSLCLTASLAVFIAPAVLSVIGIGFFQNLSIAHILSSLGSMFTGGRPTLGILQGIAVILVGVFCLLFAEMRWSKTLSESVGREL